MELARCPVGKALGWTRSFLPVSNGRLPFSELVSNDRQNVAPHVAGRQFGPRVRPNLKNKPGKFKRADPADVAKMSFTPRLVTFPRSSHSAKTLQDSCAATIPNRRSSLPSSMWSVFAQPWQRRTDRGPFRKQVLQAASGNYRQRRRQFIQSALFHRVLDGHVKYIHRIWETFYFTTNLPE